MKAAHPDSTRPALFKYLISGDDEALIISKELPEDDARLGAQQLHEAIEGADASIFCGITCGLSAPYVGGQIEAALKHGSCTPVLIGFNPVKLARDVPVEGWDRTTYQVFADLERAVINGESAFILNPVVGPEAVTGSSRMKGGSMTKILIESVFMSALIPHCGGGSMSSSAAAAAPPPTPLSMLRMFEEVYRDTYRSVAELGEVIEMAGDCLKKEDGHLYYIGDNSFGLVALMDASEMVDTYGCRIDEIRAFITDGWACFENAEGDLSSHGKLFRLSAVDFEQDILATLTAHDAVVFINIPATSPSLLEKVKKSPAKVACVTVCTGSNPASSYVTPAPDDPLSKRVLTTLTTAELVPSVPFWADFSTKLLLNAVTTGANVLKGAVYGNSMINLTVSNNKLFHRSAKIIHGITTKPLEECKDCLLKAINSVDTIPDELRALPMSVHIELGTPKANIVPTAALIAVGLTYAEAVRRLGSSGGATLKELIAQSIAESK